MTGLNPVARLLMITAIVDAVFSVGAAIAWLLVGSVSPPVLAAAYALRIPATTLALMLALQPVTRVLRLGDEAADADVLAADEVVQDTLERAGLLFALGWVGSGLGAYAITLAVPSLGIVVADAEHLLTAMGTAASGLLSYAIFLSLMAVLTRPLLRIIARQVGARGLAPPRPQRSFATTLRRFLTAFLVGVLMLVGSVGGKALVDATRARAASNQLTRAALAVDDHRRGQALDPSLERVAAHALPSVLERTDDDRAASGFDPHAELAIGAVRLDANTWLVSSEHPQDRLWPVALTFLMLVAVFGGATYASAAGIARGVIGSLDVLRGATRDMVERGELSALARAAPEREDEVGALVRDFNAMLDMLDGLARAAEAVAAGELEIELDEPGDLHDAFRTMVAQLREMVTQLRETSLELSSASVEIRASAAAQEQAIVRLSSDAKSAHRTTAELADAARAINDAAAGVSSSAELGVETTELVSTRIAALGRQAAGIGELLDQVREIADRSDLLALNGSLEATRAGEAGRGFALVSAEMRRLAERVTATVVEMRERIAGIEAAGSETVEAMARSRVLIEGTARAARDISALTAEQGANTDRASATSSAIADFVVEASSGAAQIRAASEGLHLRATELEALSQRWQKGHSPDNIPAASSTSPARTERSGAAWSRESTR